MSRKSIRNQEILNSSVWNFRLVAYPHSAIRNPQSEI